MAIPRLIYIVCITETELMQWFARGRIHILWDRIFTSGESHDGSIFATCSALKLDDAKARVLVSLVPDWLTNGNLHPGFKSRKIFSLPLSVIKELAPTLPQYRRRLESFKMPIADWSAEEEWDAWLVDQSTHEREHALIDAVKKYDYKSEVFISGNDVVEKMIRLVIRPNSQEIYSEPLLSDWLKIISRRDDILKELRFEGHDDRSSFFSASMRKVAYQCYAVEIFNAPDLPVQDSGWIIKSLSLEMIEEMKNGSWSSGIKSEIILKIFFGAIYLRIFDELFYGSKDWKVIADFIIFLKEFLDEYEGDMLTLALLASCSADEIRILDLSNVFEVKKLIPLKVNDADDFVQIAPVNFFNHC